MKNEPTKAISRRIPVDLTSAVAITTRTGQLRMFEKTVQLSIEDGTLVKPNGLPVMSTFEGYKRQAGYAALQTLNAHTVIVDGKEQKNPHVLRDDRGQPLVATCRSFTMGYTSTGVPVISDRTVCFDMNAYRAVDLLEKCRWEPKAFVMAGIDERLPKGWLKIPVDDFVAVHVKTDAPEVLQKMKDLANRKRKMVETAQTFSQRNSIKAHPAIPFHSQKDGATALVKVLAWMPVAGDLFQWDMGAFKNRVLQIEAVVAGSAGADTLGTDAPPVVQQGQDQLHEDPEATGVIDVETADEHDTREEDHEPDPMQNPITRLRVELAEVVQGSHSKVKARVVNHLLSINPRWQIDKDPDLNSFGADAIVDTHKTHLGGGQ